MAAACALWLLSGVTAAEEALPQSETHQEAPVAPPAATVDVPLPEGVPEEMRQALPEIPLDDQMRKARDDYHAAIEGLDEEQRAALKALEAEFSATMEADMKILHRSGEMEHCLRSDRFFQVDKNNHVQRFVDWRKTLKEEQRKQQSIHRAKRGRIDYVPQQVMNEYYVYQAKMLMIVGNTLARQQMQAGVFARTDCDDLAQRLRKGE